jgi:hypothetical protein
MCRLFYLLCVPPPHPFGLVSSSLLAIIDDCMTCLVPDPIPFYSILFIRFIGSNKTNYCVCLNLIADTIIRTFDFRTVICLFGADNASGDDRFCWFHTVPYDADCSTLLTAINVTNAALLMQPYFHTYILHPLPALLQVTSATIDQDRALRALQRTSPVRPLPFYFLSSHHPAAHGHILILSRELRNTCLSCQYVTVQTGCTHLCTITIE